MCSGALFADVYLDGFFAKITLDATAPVELAAAALGDLLPGRREASTAAHEVVTVGTRRLPVTLATARPRRPCIRIRLAEVSRALDEDEVVAGWPVESAVALDQPRALAVEHDLGGGVVTISQSVASLTERRQLVPTRSYTARSGHAVALAAHLGVPIHRLPTNTLLLLLLLLYHW